MKRIHIRVFCVAAGLVPAAMHALLPLYENPQLYQQLAFHNQQLLPNLSENVVANRQQLIQWLEQRLAPEMYRQFMSSRILDSLIQTVESAVRTDMTLQYARRSLQLISRYEQKIKELTSSIEQMQAQEPLRLSSYEPEVLSSSIAPEEISSRPAQKAPTESGQELQEAGSLEQLQQESEEREQSSEEQQEQSISTAKKLSIARPDEAALIKARQEKIRQEIMQGQQDEKNGTAQPGWRERVMQKWQEFKEWTSRVLSSERSDQE